MPGVSADQLTQIFYNFYNMCEPDETHVPVRIVLQDLEERFRWAQVRQAYVLKDFPLFSYCVLCDEEDA